MESFETSSEGHKNKLKYTINMVIVHNFDIRLAYFEVIAAIA